MKKTKVLHIIPNLGIGGAEKLVLDICKFIDSEKFEVKIVSLFDSQNSVYEEIARENNIKIIFLNKKIGFDYKIIINLIKLFKKEAVDIIHTHLYVMSYVLPAAIISKKKVIIHTVHNMANKELRESVKKIMKVAYKYFNVIPVGISPYIAKTISDEYKIEASKIPCIYNGIDTRAFSKKNNFDDSIINKYDDKTIRFINVGRFTKQKNHKLLIDAFKIALESNTNLTLKLVGDGELRCDIEKYVKELGLSEQIIFRGIQKNVIKELQESDVFIMSSDWEGLPISVLEAMACSLPIISTKAGGVVDIVEQDKNGFIVTLGDRNELSDAIIRISNDRNLIRSMSEQSKNIVKKYDIRNQVNDYEKLYGAKCKE